MIFLATLSLACSAACPSAAHPADPALFQDHGALLSPEAGFVWRVPSLTGLGEAAAKSAAGQLLADPGLEAWIRVITGRGDFESPKTIQEAYGLSRGKGPAAQWDFVPELLWGKQTHGISASISSKSGSVMETVLGLGGNKPDAITRSIMENLHLQWAIQFASGEDRAAWLASVVQQFESRPDCTISAWDGGSATYRWAVGEDLFAGAKPMQEGTLRLVGQKHAVIAAGNLTLAGAAPMGSSHPVFPRDPALDDVTAAMGIAARAMGSLAWENPETAPLEELLAACAGPMAEAVSLPGQLEWIGGDRTATLRSRRPRGARKAVGAVPLSEGALTLAHPEAHVAVVTSIDRDAFAQSFRSLGATEEMIALFSQADAEVGISILPMSRGVLPQLLVAFGMKDRAATLGALLAACDQIAESTRREIFFAKAEYRGAYYVTPRFKSPGMLETLIQPCIVVTEDRIFLATDAALAKREIRRLQTEATRRVHASLVAMKAPRAGPTEAGASETGVTLAACADWAGLLTDIHGRADAILKTLGPAVLGPVSPEMLPPLGLLTRHLSPSTRWVALSGDSFTGEAHTPFGPCEFSIAAALMVSWFAVEVDSQISAGQIARAKADLTTIHSAIQRYYLMEAQWPDRLSELSLAGALPRDPWGSLYRFSIDDNGEVELRSIGPNQMDENGSGDDIDFKTILRR